jgi:hypothetical protein
MTSKQLQTVALRAVKTRKYDKIRECKNPTQTVGIVGLWLFSSASEGLRRVCG